MQPEKPETNPFLVLLAPSLSLLPPTVREIHRGPGDLLLRGQCSVERGRHWLSRLMGFCARLPPTAETLPVEVLIERGPGRERWARRFGSHAMTSRMHLDGGHLVEALGLARFRFELQGSERGIRWQPRRISALGLPLPLGWFRFDVEEREADGRYVFDVRVALAGIGLLVHYRGWLEIVEQSPAFRSSAT